jgi:Nuclease A inhibitor-like protein
MSQVEVSSHPDLPPSIPEPTPQPEVEALQALVTDLTWMSESDYPFEVSQLPDREAPTIEALQAEHATPVEEISLQDFFAPAVQPQDWHEEADRQRTQRFQTLLQWLEQHLSDVRVYRFGTIEIDILIIGKTEAGTWLKLSTKAIET